ncbi:hypothetical protein CIB84_003094, partial [Bambusicola thoracicus]
VSELSPACGHPEQFCDGHPCLDPGEEEGLWWSKVLLERCRVMKCVRFSQSLAPFDAELQAHNYFQDLLNKSEKALYDTFPSLYGELYTQNMKVFKDLYSELRRYYRGSNINLEEALNEFWTRLLERLFKQMNAQYHITDEYLDCMVKHAEQHKPFGEVPRDLKLKATRAFIVARSYAQGFLVGSDVVKKVSQSTPACHGSAFCRVWWVEQTGGTAAVLVSVGEDLRY